MMGNRFLAAFTAALAAAGCTTTNLSDIDTAGRAPACVRECTAHYSQCAGGPAVGFRGEALNACKAALRMCVSTCPPGDTASK